MVEPLRYGSRAASGRGINERKRASKREQRKKKRIANIFVLV
jgi:hypothetical protein